LGEIIFYMNWITIIGFLAATGTTISLLPQAIQNKLKQKHAKDISLGMYLMLTTGIFLWLVLWNF